MYYDEPAYNRGLHFFPKKTQAPVFFQHNSQPQKGSNNCLYVFKNTDSPSISEFMVGRKGANSSFMILISKTSFFPEFLPVNHIGIMISKVLEVAFLLQGHDDSRGPLQYLPFQLTLAPGWGCHVWSWFNSKNGTPWCPHVTAAFRENPWESSAGTVPIWDRETNHSLVMSIGYSDIQHINK